MYFVDTLYINMYVYVKLMSQISGKIIALDHKQLQLLSVI